MAKQRLGAKLVKQLKRLNDPKDTAAAITFAAFLLVAEAVLCSLIIWKVPCESLDGLMVCVRRILLILPAWIATLKMFSPGPADTEIDWMAYMQEVRGYQQV